MLASGCLHRQVVRPRPGWVPEAGAVFIDWLGQILPASSQVAALWGCCSGHAQFRTQQGVSHHIGALSCPSRCCTAYGAQGGRGPRMSFGADSVCCG